MRVIGASNYEAPRLAEALKTPAPTSGLPRYESLQPHYNLFDRAGFERRAGAAVPEGEDRRHPLLLRWPAAS